MADVLAKKNNSTQCGNILCGRVRTNDVEEIGWTKKKINGAYKYLCKVCTGAYSNKQFCYYCKQIYLDQAQNNAIVDGQEWIACENCNRWNHLKCESQNGCKDIQVLLLDENFKYFCAECSRRKSSIHSSNGCSGKIKKKCERKKKSAESSKYCLRHIDIISPETENDESCRRSARRSPTNNASSDSQVCSIFSHTNLY